MLVLGAIVNVVQASQVVQFDCPALAAYFPAWQAVQAGCSSLDVK
jgi:hypothetical protein